MRFNIFTQTCHYQSMLLGLILLLTFTCCNSCGEDDEQPCVDAFNPDCPNYDPCLSVLPAQPDNIAVIDSVSTTFGDLAMGVLVDTLGRGTTLYFRPEVIREDATYQWQIGSDPRIFNDSVLDVNFTGFTGDVEVRLVTLIDDTFGCLSNAETIDTSYYNFYVDDLAIAEYPVHGIFSGTLESNPEEEISIEVYRYETSSSSSTRIRGFPLDCYEDGPNTRLAGGLDWFVTSHHVFDFRCRELTAVGRLRENDHRVLEVNYTYVDDDGKTVEERFIGYRQ